MEERLSTKKNQIPYDVDEPKKGNPLRVWSQDQSKSKSIHPGVEPVTRSAIEPADPFLLKYNLQL